MSLIQTQNWLFNTDETEPEGEGKHAVMLRRQVVAAWGSCKKLGAEVTLNRPKAGDRIYYFRAGHGIIARAQATDVFASESQAIFRAVGEYVRPVEQLQVLPDDSPITVGEIKEATGYQIPYRQIMGRILNSEASNYLDRRFGRTPKKRPVEKPAKPTGGYKVFVQPDPEVRKKVEKAAVRAVTRVYEKSGWTVKSVESENVGYDLHCTRGRSTEKVEVKGTVGDEQRFVITANELAKAGDTEFVLYVVTNALNAPKPKKYSGKQLLASFDFQPVQYRAIAKAN